MPEIGLTPLVGVFGAPSIEVKYDVYWPPTLAEKNRSRAYFTSAEVTARFTGGLNFTPCLILTVTVFPPSEICAGPAARSGEGCVVSFGLYVKSVRCSAPVSTKSNW